MGTEVDGLDLPTCAVLGYDGRLYLDTLERTNRVLPYHSGDLQVSSPRCSKALNDWKYVKTGKLASPGILGILIDPILDGLQKFTLRRV